jgi:membrane-associated phospholipid phosphatase
MGNTDDAVNTTDTLLSKFDLVDKAVSGLIHTAIIRPRFLEYIVLPFAFIFNPIFVPVLIFTIGFVIPKHNKPLVDNGDEEQIVRRFSPYHYILQYIAQILIVLILTTFKKKFFARNRPTVPSASQRTIDFRTKETNGSFPSGDTAQAALFAFFIKYNFEHIFVQLGGDFFIIKFITLVAFARVFHHCHYFGDTIAGGLLGYSVATAFYALEIVLPVPELLLESIPVAI